MLSFLKRLFGEQYRQIDLTHFYQMRFGQILRNLLQMSCLTKDGAKYIDQKIGYAAGRWVIFTLPLSMMWRTKSRSCVFICSAYQLLR
jgi:hypothetical protein